MKKLLISIGCISAAIIMTSCTTDDIEDTEKETLNNYNNISGSTTDTVTPLPTLIDDKDKSKG